MHYTSHGRVFEIDQLGCRQALECVFVCLQYFFYGAYCCFGAWALHIVSFCFSTDEHSSTTQQRGFCFPFLLIFTRLVFSCSSINRLFVTYLLAYSHTASVHTYIHRRYKIISFVWPQPALPTCLSFNFSGKETSFFPTFRCSYRTAFLSSFSVR